MKSVTPFAANLLRILRGLLRQAPLEQILPLILREFPGPARLSRDALNLVEDSLAKGCTLILAREGGWRRERFLRGDRIAQGRLWQRTPPAELGLSFSHHSLELLIWLTAADPLHGTPGGSTPKFADSAPGGWTGGDRLLCFLAYDALRESAVRPVLVRSQPFATDGLIRLMFPDDFPNQPISAVDFKPWVAGVGAGILEAFQSRLAQRWASLPWERRHVAESQASVAGTGAQESALQALLEALEAAERRDLAGFLLAAAALFLRESSDPEADLTLRPMDRSAELQQRRFPALAALDRLQAWNRAARGIGYLDEGYAASQLWKSEWERWEADSLCRRVSALTQQAVP
jgi:hypothetical protein